MEPMNLLYIISDQHNAAITGCYGHDAVQTPRLDQLAAEGTQFDCAYTPSPICVPARAAIATGQYVHQMGYWDNGSPYDGRVKGWGHRLKEQGYRVDSIGKLHFRKAEDDCGFDQSHEAMYVVEGLGDLLSCVRDNPPFRNARPGIEEAGSGDSTYLQYDRQIAKTTCEWLESHKDDEKPWVLFASFVNPHPPYIAPEAYYNLYDPDELPLPPQWHPDDWPQHPAMDYMRRYFSFDTPFSEETIRRMNNAYYGMCSFLDAQIGKVLDMLDASGLSQNTRIVYTSDHGEHLGGRGVFGKFSMYEESSRVPLIIRGPDVPAGNTVKTPVSLLDTFQTVIESVGADYDETDYDLPGESLWSIAEMEDQDRIVFSEYHAVGAKNATFMIRDMRYKFIYHVDNTPQLFDLTNDPQELNDMAANNQNEQLVQEYETKLRNILDPEFVDQQAKAHQAAKIEAFGGRQAVIKRGAFQNSPTPGETPKFLTPK